MSALEILLLVGSVFASLSLAMFTLHKNSKSATNRLFFIFTVLLAFYAITNHLINLKLSSDWSFFWVKVVMTAALFINLAFFLLVKTFPKHKLQLATDKLVLLTIATLTLIPPIWTNLLFTSVSITGDAIVSEPGIAMAPFLVHTILLLGGGFFFLVKKFKDAQNKERQQLRFLLMGLIIMFAAILFTNLLLVVIFNVTSFISLLPIYILFFTSLTTYAIVKHRLLDIGFLVARAVSFTLLTGLIAVIYTSAIFSLPLFFADQYHAPITVILGVIVAFTFSPLRRFIEKITVKYLHKHSYTSDELLEKLGETIRSTLSINTLTQEIVKDLQNTLHPTTGAFFLIQENNQISVKNFDYDPIPDLDVEQLKYLARKADNSILVSDEVDNKKIKNLLNPNHISLVVPLRSNQKINGIFVLGEKASGEAYTNQDLNVLEIIGPQISIAIQNSLAYDEIKRFNVTLKQKVKEATKDLRKANKDLRHLDKLKDEFVFVATHELKTPVTVIKGYTSMIESGQFGEVPDQLREATAEIEKANQQLVGLVNNLLDIARSEVKQTNVDPEPVNICDIVEATVQNIYPLAEQKHLKLNYSCPTEKMMVKADPDRLQEILNNLLSNAIKYSEKGEITVTHVDDSDAVITHVADQGVGISEEDQQKVFTRFFRAEEQAGKVPGTGLGSFIVKQLVEKMGGRIWFTSKLGEGTTFSFSLPKAPKSSLKTKNKNKNDDGQEKSQNKQDSHSKNEQKTNDDNQQDNDPSNDQPDQNNND